MKRKYKEYFDYYIELENDFFDTEAYVSIEEDNYKTYSIKYVKIYLSICSEIDCLLKEICRNLDNSTTASKINEYYPIINIAFNNFKSESVYYEKQKIELYPWEEWEEGNSPKWWQYYNKVKHQRMEEEPETNITYYKYANLENVLNALAALYIVEQYYMYSYNYLNEAEIPDIPNREYLTLEGMAESDKESAMFMFTSSRCYMKRWKDNGCYYLPFFEQYADLERLDYIVHYE